MAQKPDDQADTDGGKDGDANSGRSGAVPGQGSQANQAKQGDETSARTPTESERSKD